MATKKAAPKKKKKAKELWVVRLDSYVYLVDEKPELVRDDMWGLDFADGDLDYTFEFCYAEFKPLVGALKDGECAKLSVKMGKAMKAKVTEIKKETW